MTDNRDQQEFWTDIAGPKWAEHQRAMDALMQPILDGVISRAELKPGAQVLDIGCGTGASVIAAADQVEASGHVLGADISSRLLDVARLRTKDLSNITLVDADAASHPFDEARFDNLISRFGVMFFSDPVAAFANMAKGLKPGARLVFAAWGDIRENPFFTYAAQAARDVLGPIPKSDPDAPGPFAFRDPDRVSGILSDAGFSNLDIDVEDLHLRPSGPLTKFAEQLCDIGPAESALKHFEANAQQRADVEARLAEVFAPFETDGHLRVPARINFVSATA